MATVESLGIKRIESVHYYVHDLERSRRFYTEVMDFAEIGGSASGADRPRSREVRGLQGRQLRGHLHRPPGRGRPRLALPAQAPRRRRHPDLRGRGHRAGLPPAGGSAAARRSTTSSASRTTAGKLAFFSITTPFGDTTFRFIERQGYRPLFPASRPHPEPRGGRNSFGFDGFDHITSNFQTMSPALLWLEHVMGFERFW